MSACSKVTIAGISGGLVHARHRRQRRDLFSRGFFLFVQERADDGATHPVATSYMSYMHMHMHMCMHMHMHMCAHVHVHVHMMQIVGDSAGGAIAADIAVIYLPLIVRDGSADTVGPQTD